MTSEQIIKANKLCAMPTSILCEECPYHHLRDTDSDCVEVMTNDTIDLIEGLINGQISLQKALAEKIEESENQSQNFKVLISDHRTLQQSFDNLKGLYEAEKAKVEKAKEKSIYFAKELQKAKSELKETTEKFNCQQIVYADLSDIMRMLLENLQDGMTIKIIIPCVCDNWGGAVRAVYPEDFGKTVFLTREEVEEALQKRGADNG